MESIAQAPVARSKPTAPQHLIDDQQRYSFLREQLVKLIPTVKNNNKKRRFKKILERLDRKLNFIGRELQKYESTKNN